MPGVVLETERLLLREFTEDDAEAFFELNRRPEVVEFTGEECATSVEQMRTGIRDRIIANYRQFGYGRWAVIFRDHARLIGFAGLKYLESLKAVDLGYRLLPEYWGQGLATEASRAVVRYGFETLRMDRILGLVLPQHAKSIRVLEKVGFVYDGIIDYQSQQVAQYVIEPPRGVTTAP